MHSFSSTDDEVQATLKITKAVEGRIIMSLRIVIAIGIYARTIISINAQQDAFICTQINLKCIDNVILP